MANRINLICALQLISPAGHRAAHIEDLSSSRVSRSWSHWCWSSSSAAAAHAERARTSAAEEPGGPVVVDGTTGRRDSVLLGIPALVDRRCGAPDARWRRGSARAGERGTPSPAGRGAVTLPGTGVNCAARPGTGRRSVSSRRRHAPGLVGRRRRDRVGLAVAGLLPGS